MHLLPHKKHTYFICNNCSFSQKLTSLKLGHEACDATKQYCLYIILSQYLIISNEDSQNQTL